MRILHCFRAPVGGLFRHVLDLAQGQAEAGYEVGLLCDETTGGDAAIDALDLIEHDCALGIHRTPMARLISPRDVSATRRLAELARFLEIDILHGHGAKGGAYARIAAQFSKSAAVYTPHGGSLHYSATSPAGLVFLTLEKLLARRSGGLIFESQFSRDVFAAKVRADGYPARVIPNGLKAEEFAPVPLVDKPDDILFIGELRHLKGVDLLLDAMSELANEGTPLTATIVGSGPDEETFKAQARDLALDGQVKFVGAKPARDAFALARLLVVPSRAESFPYIVLEATAARKPVIATRVGGIPEIFGDHADRLIAPDQVGALKEAIRTFIDDPASAAQTAEHISLTVGERFRVGGMVASINAFYHDVLGTDAPAAVHGATAATPAE